MDRKLILKEADRQKKIDATFFVKFKDFPYNDWKPARQRIEFINKYAKGKSLLDIGCGFYPVTTEVKIPRKVGLDVSMKAARKSWTEFTEFYFLDLTQSSKEFLKKQLGTFDVIVASEFLEHIENPLDAIKKMAFLLNKNGRILLTMPNGSSIAGTIDKLRNHGTYNRFKLFHRTHVSFLKTQEWEELFYKAGLKIEVFDFRPSDFVDNFPKEKWNWWKKICALAPNYFAHQFFYVLKKN
ncbi:class I SAM-dependent methyltransferase [archaeon]|nr:class I SAM-dependent methyltransferase [archaeon]